DLPLPDRRRHFDFDLARLGLALAAVALDVERGLGASDGKLRRTGDLFRNLAPVVSEHRRSVAPGGLKSTASVATCEERPTGTGKGLGCRVRRGGRTPGGVTLESATERVRVPRRASLPRRARRSSARPLARRGAERRASTRAWHRNENRATNTSAAHPSVRKHPRTGKRR